MAAYCALLDITVLMIQPTPTALSVWTASSAQRDHGIRGIANQVCQENQDINLSHLPSKRSKWMSMKACPIYSSNPYHIAYSCCSLTANKKITVKKIIMYTKHQSTFDKSLILIPIDLCIRKPRWPLHIIVFCIMYLCLQVTTVTVPWPRKHVHPASTVQSTPVTHYRVRPVTTVVKTVIPNHAQVSVHRGANPHPFPSLPPPLPPPSHPEWTLQTLFLGILETVLYKEHCTNLKEHIGKIYRIRGINIK